MYEKTTAQTPAYELPFCTVELPTDWDGKRTVRITNEDGDDAMMTVAPAAADALRRAAALMPLGLCRRLNLGIAGYALHIVEVYWES